MTNEENDGLRGLFEAARAQASAVARDPIFPQPEMLDRGIPFVVVPDGFRLESLEKQIYNDHNLHPERKRGNVVVADPASFMNYWDLYAGENSQAFASPDGTYVVGILDYHGVGSDPAGWKQHQVVLHLRHSDEWKLWTGGNRKAMEQAPFAEFLEENAPDIIKPDSAVFVDMARDLKATTSVEFGSSIKAQSGAIVLNYTENINGTVGKDSLEIPEYFTLRIPVYLGTEPIEIAARFRYRINGGKLMLHYVLYREQAAARAMFDKIVSDISQTIGKAVMMGTP